MGLSASKLKPPGNKERQCLATRCELRLKVCCKQFSKEFSCLCDSSCVVIWIVRGMSSVRDALVSVCLSLLSACMFFVGTLATDVCCAEVLFKPSFLHAERSTKRTTEPDTLGASSRDLLTRISGWPSESVKVLHTIHVLSVIFVLFFGPCCTHKSRGTLGLHFPHFSCLFLHVFLSFYPPPLFLLPLFPFFPTFLPHLPFLHPVSPPFTPPPASYQ